jgi:LPS export ABC transporter protein LptC
MIGFTKIFGGLRISNLIPIGLFLQLIIISGCENDIEKIKLVAKKSKTPTETGKHVEIYYSDSARIRLQIKAERMDHYPTENPYLEMTDGVEVLFYDDSMQIKSKLTANYAIHMEKERKMEARKNVVVINEKGEQLNTEHLIWDEQTARIFSDEFVKITTSDEIIYGQGFESNQNFTKYRINKIKGNIKIKH